MPARKGKDILGEGTAPDLSPYTETTVAAVSVLCLTSRSRFCSKPRSVLASLSGDRGRFGGGSVTAVKSVCSSSALSPRLAVGASSSPGEAVPSCIML
jgi:hypothetical protein